MVPGRNFLIHLVRPPTECVCVAAQPISSHLRIKVGVTNESGTQLLKLKHWRKGMRKGSTGCKCWWWPLAKISVTSAVWSEVVVHVRGETWTQIMRVLFFRQSVCFTSVQPKFREQCLGFKVFIRCFFFLRWIWLIADRLGVRDATPKTAVRLVVAWPYK